MKLGTRISVLFASALLAATLSHGCGWPRLRGDGGAQNGVEDSQNARIEAGVCAPRTIVCAMSGCVDLQSSDSNCGACGTVCTNGQTCQAAVCACPPRFVLLAGRCIATFPRPILPLSLGDVSLRSPTLRWELAAGSDGTSVELCRDRACTMLIETLQTAATSVRPTNPLPSNSVVFWRLRGTTRGVPNMTYSPTWLFHVPARDNSGGIDTSANAHLDVNGDGFGDIVVGAEPISPDERLRAGTASVYHGSATGIPMAPARVLAGLLMGDRFGCSVASAGDVNGDGFGDLVVGASDADPGGRSGAGTASVFLGSPMGLPVTPTRVLEGVARDDGFGSSVAGAGDVNGDGFGDLVVGAFRAAPDGRSLAGTASVYYGSGSGISEASTHVFAGVRAGDRFGRFVSGAGDLNGDGFGDFVVSAARDDLGRSSLAGTVSVYHGSAMGGPAAPARVLEGVAPVDYFGGSVASAGDVNGDGFGDLTVSSPWLVSPGGRLGTGTASVFHGSAMGVPMAPARVLQGVAPNAYFGQSVAGAADVNGDGFGDLVVGGSIPVPGQISHLGTASVFHGSAMGVPMAPARVLQGVLVGDGFGLSRATAADVNGDGFGDLVVGAMHADPGGRNFAGTASVFHGSAMGVSMAPARILEGVMAGDRFGLDVAIGGDLLWRTQTDRTANSWLVQWIRRFDQRV